MVARFNGGANAGHTVVANGRKFAFHLLPCGVVHPHTVNLLGNGTVIHVESLFKELAELDAAGVAHAGRVLVSDRAHLLLDAHKAADGAMEERRAAAGSGKIGTTRQGIGPAYASKASRTGLRAGLLRHPAAFRDALERLAGDLRASYGVAVDVPAELAKFEALAPRLVPMIVDGVDYVHTALADGKRVIAEGANAALLDVDFGTYPYVTSSSTTAGGVATGLGLAPRLLEAAVGVVKAYTTRVGGGPFPTELTDSRGGGERPDGAPGTDVGLHLQTAGGEVGVTTGRKRRCGWFDAEVVRFAHRLNGFTSLNLTKLDVLDDVDIIRVGVGYKLRGARVPPGAMPAALQDLADVEVEYEGASRECGEALVGVEMALSLSRLPACPLARPLVSARARLSPPRDASAPPTSRPPPRRSSLTPHPALRRVPPSPAPRPPPAPADMPGWKTSTRGCTRFDALPPAARAYVRRIEALVGVPVAWVGTGPGRTEMVTRGFKLA